MIQPLYPCLWFDGQAKAAAEFYCSVFPGSQITADTPVVVNFELSGQKFMGLNGGPAFKINSAISFFALCESPEETENVWNRLLDGGKVLMPLDKYPWSDKFGWLEDRFGLSWQVYLGKMAEVGQKFTPCLTFTGGVFGKADEAIHFYTSVFKDSSIAGILHYKEGKAEDIGTVQHGQFTINNSVMMAMDSSLPHAFSFNEAISFVVSCDTQEEIDYHWEKLTEGGEEGRCGWLKDKFGVSWQVVPSILGKLMSDRSRGERVVKAFMQMKKFEIKKLQEA